MPIANIHLVYPLCAMFLLTTIVLVVMFAKRVKAIKAGKTDATFYKTFSRGNGEDEETAKATRHFTNLFEAPILFYVACILGMLVPVNSILFVFFAWGYVFVRALHAYVHIGPNKLFIRMRVYFVGWVILATMWAMILFKAISISSLT